MSERDGSLCFYVAGLKGEEKIFPLDKDGMLIGRDQSCDVVLPDSSISKKHSQVILENGRTMITDGAEGSRSANGVYVNDTRISQPTTIKDGDVVKMGVLRFEVRYTSSVRNAIAFDEVRDLAALKIFLERGDLRKIKEENVIHRLRELSWEGSEMLSVFDETLDLAMDRNELQRVAFISRAKQEALKLLEERGRRAPLGGAPSKKPGGRDPDATIVDLGASSATIKAPRGKRMSPIAKAGLALVAALIALALISMFIY